MKKSENVHSIHIRIRNLQTFENYQKWVEYYKIHYKPMGKSMNSIFEEKLCDIFLNDIWENNLKSPFFSNLQKAIKNINQSLLNDLKYREYSKEIDVLNIINLKLNLLLNCLITNKLISEKEIELPDIDKLQIPFIWEREIYDQLESKKRNFFKSQKISEDKNEEDF